MTKTQQPGFIKNEKLFLINRNGLQEDVRSFPDCDVLVTVEKNTGRKSREQQGYYWAVLVPHTLIILRDICGYNEYKTLEDAHTFLKYRHNPVYVPNVDEPEKAERMPGSTKKMSKEQKMKYIDDIIMEGWEKWEYTYPPAKSKKDKYYFQ